MIRRRRRRRRAAMFSKYSSRGIRYKSGLTEELSVETLDRVRSVKISNELSRGIHFINLAHFFW
jgi:hypothetical protein